MPDTPVVADQDLRASLDQFVRELQAVLGDELVRVVLFGSHARRTASEDSDVDLLVVLRSLTPYLKEAVHSVAYDVMWRHDFRFLLSVLAMDEAGYGQMLTDGQSFARNVQREGIALWAKAA